MAKLTLSDLSGGYLSPALVNANNALIEAALENTLSRDGTSPNAMGATLDMDSNRIINLPAPASMSDAARLADISDSGFSALAESTGAGLIGFSQLGIGAVAENLQAAARRLGLFPEQFGALADGTTDDSAAIQAAIDAVETAGGGNLRLTGNIYNIGSTEIVVPDSVAVIADRGAEFKYSTSATGTALTIEGSENLGGRVHILPRIIKGDPTAPLWFTGTDTTSKGVKFIDCKYDHFFVPSVQGFFKGLSLENNVANTVCNTFYLGRIRNNQKGIKLDPEGVTWGVNQNTFIGGSIYIASNFTSPAGRASIEMIGVETNGTTFVGVNLEANAGTELVIDCGSSQNIWLNCRWEAIPAGSIKFRATANGNMIFGGAGNEDTTGGRWNTRVSDSGDGNIYMWRAVLSGDGFALNFKDTLGVLKFGNQTTAPSVPLGAFGTNRLWIGDSNTTGVRYFGAIHQEEKIVTSGTGPTLDANFVQLNYASPTTLTGAGGVGAPSAADVSAHLVLFDLNGNITLTHTTSPAAGTFKFVLAAGVNKVLRALTPYHFVSFNGNWYEVADSAYLQGSATFNPADLADGVGETTTVTVTGAALGDFAEASFSLDLQGITLTAWVSAADTVSVRFQNETTGNVNLAEGTLRARVRKA